MSRDNAVLIMRIKCRSKLLWIVLHTQSHELFGDPQWTRWWLWAHPVHYTSRRSTAMRIARKLASEIQRLEHGVVEFLNRVLIDDAILFNGKIYFEPQQENVRPVNIDDMSNEQDWRKIDFNLPNA